jgi:hypothetical protein
MMENNLLTIWVFDAHKQNGPRVKRAVLSLENALVVEDDGGAATRNVVYSYHRARIKESPSSMPRGCPQRFFWGAIKQWQSMAQKRPLGLIRRSGSEKHIASY